jgi:hypothetical protein
MLGFLRGVPGKITALATQITGLGSPAQASTVGTPAQASTALSTTNWTNSHATGLAATNAAMTSYGPPVASSMPSNGPQVAPSGLCVNTTTADAPAEMAYRSGGQLVSGTTVASTWVTLLTISGAGVLTFAAQGCSSSAAAQYQMIVDGVTYSVSSTDGRKWAVMAGALSWVDTTIGSQPIFALDQIPFKTSVVFKVYSTSAGLTGYLVAKYRRAS